jgi:hypothetical protein
VRLKATNALSAKKRPSKVTCKLRTKEKLKIISGIKNVLLVPVLAKLLITDK